MKESFVEKIKYLLTKKTAVLVAVVSLLLIPLIVFSNFVDDTESEFNQGVYEGVEYDTGSSALKISTTTNAIGEFPDNQSSDWISMSDNKLLLHLNENTSDSTTIFTDSSGQGNNGSCPTDSECPSVTSSGKMYGAMSFDGSDDYLNLGQNSSLDISGDFTIGMWIKPNTVSNWQALYIFEGGSDRGLWVRDDGSLVYWDSAFFSDSISGGSLSADSWNHVSVTRSDDKWSLYINGDSVYSTTKSGSLSSLSKDVLIGHDYDGYEFNGEIDEVSVFDKAISSSQIQKIYNRQSPKILGKFTSNIFDAGERQIWDKLSWTPKAPYYKELPDNGGAETGYSEGNIDMSGLNNLALWHLNSTDASDSSGNGNDGTPKNSITTGIEGKFNKAFSFDGNDNYIDIPGSILNTNSDSGSISVWVKSSSTQGTESIFSTVENRDRAVYTQSGQFKAAMYDGGFGSFRYISGGVVKNSWSHLVFTWNINVGELKLYVNGEKVDSYSGSSWTDAPSDSGSYLGKNFGFISASPDNFTGKMDEVAIFDNVLSETTVRDLYDRGAKRLKFQVRSCDDSACLDETFTGPDGTSNSYYTSESSNTTNTPYSNLSLGNIPLNQYFQYKTFLESDTTSSPNLSSVSISTTTNSAPSLIINATPKQINGSEVVVTTTISDPEQAKTSIEVEYSTDNSSYKNATISSASDLNDEGDGVTISSNNVEDIDTNNDGSVDVQIKWDIDADIPDAEDGSVYLRLTPDDGSKVGSEQISNSFDVDNYADPSDLSDDDIGDFYEGGFNNTNFDSDNNYLYSLGGLGLPNNQSNGWIDMSSNELLLHLNEGSTDSGFSDSSGNGHPGSCSGGGCPTPTNNARVDSAMYFDGSDDYINIGRPSSLTETGLGDSASIMIWINPGGDFSIDEHIFGLRDNNSNDNFAFFNSSGAVRFYTDTTGGYGRVTIPPSKIADGWHLLVGTYDGSQSKFFVDGSLVGTNSNVSGNLDNTTNARWTIGGRYESGSGDYVRNFEGFADEAVIFNDALTESEIKEIYERQKGHYGEFTSRIFNPGAENIWNSFSWIPKAPYSKPLPDNQEVETDYSTGNIDMSNNIGLWHFDTIGATSTDASGNENNGILNGDIKTGRDGKINESLGFDGGDYVNVGSGMNSAIEASDEITFSSWVYATSSPNSYPHIVGGGDDGKKLQIWWLGGDGSGNIEYRLTIDGSQTKISSNDGMNYGEWYHIVGTYDGSQMKIYVDGEQEDSTLVSGEITSINSDIYIGDNPNLSPRGFGGKIDEVAFFDKALSDQDIKSIYNRGVKQTKFQVRSCDDPACSGESFVGPDGTANTYFSETTPSTISSSTPLLGLIQTIEKNQYFQYKTFLESDTTSSPKLSSVNISTTTNSAPSLTINGSPEQVSGSGVVVTTTITDNEYNETNIKLEYSLNNIGWNDATISSATDLNNEGDGVTTSTHKVENIDTDNDTSADVKIKWNIDADIPNTENDSVYLRLTPDDGNKTGSAQVSNSFDVDNKVDPADLVDDDKGDFYDGVFNNTNFDTDNNYLRINQFGGGWSLPNDQKNDWIDMSNNQVLFHLNGNGSSTSFEDSSGNNNDGSCSDSNCPIIVSDGRVGSAISFDGNDDYVDLNTKVGAGNSVLTLMAWVKPDDLSEQRAIFGEYDSGSNNGYIFSLTSNNEIKFYDGSINYYSDNSVVEKNKWQHITIVFDGNNNKIKFYYDGKKIDEKNGASNLSDGNDTVLGWCNESASFSCPFSGKIDEAAIFNRVLTSDEINNIYKRQKGLYGEFTSRIFNPGAENIWNNFSWIPKAPYSKPLPDNQAVETEYNSRNVDMSSNLGMWHLDDSTATATDSSGNDNDGVLKNGITTGVEGKFGNAMSFDGSDDYVDIDNLPDQNKFTFSAWFKPNNNNQAAIISLSNDTTSNNRSTIAIDSGDNLGYWDSNNGWTRTGVDPSLNEWTHVAVKSEDNNYVSIFVDGEKLATSSINSLPSGRSHLYIGREDPSNNELFSGKIDEVAVFNAALSDQDIKSIYNRGVKQVKFQVRSCDDSACSGESFVGPDGTANSYFSELTPTTTLSSTPSVSLNNISDNQYFQYQTILTSENTSSPKLKSTTIGGELKNERPTTTIDTVPSQFSSTIVSTTLTITDVDQDESDLLVEYSTDGTTYNNATIGTVSDINNEGDGVTISGSNINGIDTDNDGTVNLSINWDADPDIPDTEDNTVYLRFTPSDSIGSGTANTSVGFPVDTAQPSKPGKLSVSSGNLTSSTIKLGFPATNSTDGNFDKYKIYLSSSTPANANNNDIVYTSSTDSNLSAQDFNSASETNKITGLNPNTKYYNQLFAYDTYDNVTSSNEASTTTLAAIPDNFTTTTVTTSSIQLSWGSNNNPSGTIYEVKNETTGGSNTTTNTNLTLDNLTPDTNYTLKVRAKNSAGKFSSYTNTISKITLANTPSAPSLSNATTSTIDITINENNNPASTKYAIYNDTDNSNLAADGTDNGNTPVYQTTSTWSGAAAKNLSINKKYKFNTIAQNKEGQTTSSSPTSTALSTLAAKPNNLAVGSVTTSSIQLDWSSNSNPNDTTYDIENVTSSTTNTTSTTSTTFTNLSSNVEYTFKVRAQNRDGVHTSYTNTTSAYTYATVPTNLTKDSATQNSITFSWQGNGTKYKVHATDNSKSIDNITTTTKKVSGLTCGNSYTYEVKAFNGDDVATSYSSSTQASTNNCPEQTSSGGGGGGSIGTGEQDSEKVQESLSPVVNIQSTTSSAKITIDTEQPSLAKLIYGKQDSYNYQTDYQSSFSRSHTISLDQLGSNADYKVKVKVQDSNKNTIELGPYSFNTIPEITVPPNPDEFSVDLVDRSTQLNWINPTNTTIKKIQVNRSTDMYPLDPDQGEVVLDTNNENQQSYRDSEVQSNTTYYYSLFIQNEDNQYSSGVLQSITTPQFEEQVDTEEPKDEPVQDEQPEETPAEPKEEADESKKEQEDKDVFDEIKDKIDDITGGDTETTTEKEPTTTERIPEEELPDPIPDDEIFDKVEETDKPTTPTLAEPLAPQETAVDDSQFNFFSLVKQSAQKTADSLTSAAQQAQKLSEQSRDQLQQINKDLVDQAGNLSRRVYEQLPKQQKEEVKENLDKPLPPEFDSSTVANIQPMKIDSEKAKKYNADWHVFAGSDSLLSIPQSAFKKNVRNITVAFKDQAYVLRKNEETNNYEAVIKAPEKKGKYEMAIQVIYEDNTYEEITKTTLVDPYGYVYRTEFKDFSWTKPWQMFTTKRVKIEDSVVTLHTKNKTNEWVEWPAHLYNQQNPQTTADNGRFAFVVPEGEYYLQVQHDKYPNTETDVFKVRQEVVNINVELDPITQRTWFWISTAAVIVMIGGGVWFSLRRRKL